ncbi:MAG TPA: Zn-dependent hydrolase [Candidatus Acidoferrales bacterium]|nr:Zn-dependent hydrolase [Candidatus Acidoferrales bacterium]
MRRFLPALAALLALFLAAGATPFAGGARRQTPRRAAALHVQPDRLRQTLEKLSTFGRNPDGGVTRLGFSPADMAARQYVMDLMKQAGLAVRVDPAGNIFGSRPGTQKLPLLLFGSHIDSVPHGGNFDGDVGSLGAIEVIRALNDRRVTTRHPLEVVVWANEEGDHFGVGIFGSSAAAGVLAPAVLNRRDDQGLTLADWLRRYGQDPARISQAKITPGSVGAYVELHIEQGAVLDRAKIPIGVVQGIVGIGWWDCVATGFANHAGTTPMNRRQDALVAASKAVIALRDEVRAQPGRQVGTTGFMKVEPGARNIIPGRVEFPVEIRDLDASKINRIWARVQARFAQIARDENVPVRCSLLDFDQPAKANPMIQQTIRDAARSAGLAFLDMPSGAGHDAQNAARFTRMGMIFVPSRNGISHSPLEFTPWKDVGNGAEVLYRTIVLLDQRLDTQ